jgi:hypothetical protein
MGNWASFNSLALAEKPSISPAQINARYISKRQDIFQKGIAIAIKVRTLHP